MNACEVKARPDRIVGKLDAVCFWQPTPSVLSVIVAAALRDSVWAVSLLPCMADLYLVYCMLVRLSGCLNHIKGKIIIIIIIANTLPYTVTLTFDFEHLHCIACHCVETLYRI